MKYTLIDSRGDLPDIDKITYSDFAALRFTANMIEERIDKTNFRKKYRAGVQTNIGNVERTLWYTFAQDLIFQSGDKALYEAMTKWVIDNCPHITSQKEIQEYAIELVLDEVYKDRSWAGAKEFRTKYYKQPQVVKRGRKPYSRAKYANRSVAAE